MEVILLEPRFFAELILFMDSTPLCVESIYIEKFIKEISIQKGCSYHINSELIEYVIDVAGTSESNLEVIYKAMSDNIIRSSKLACTFCLKLFRKFLEFNNEFYKDEVITDFLRSCFEVVDVEDFSFLCAIFELMIKMEKQNKADAVNSDAWNLAIICLKNERMSVFVKQSASVYCELLISKNKGALDMGMLISKLYDSEDAFEHIAGIFSHYPDFISEEIAKKICSNATKSGVLNFSYTKLLAILFEKHSYLKSIFTSDKWLSQRLKLGVLRDMVSNGCADIVPILVSEPNLLLDDIILCLPYLPHEEKEHLVDYWIKRLNDKVRCPSQSVFNFLQLPWVSEVHYDLVFEVLKERFWSSPELLKVMVQKHESWGLRRQDDIISLISKGLSSSDWEKRDVAVEVLRLLPEIAFLKISVKTIMTTLRSLCFNDVHPFVRANILRFLDEKHENSLMDIAVEVIRTEMFNEPRLEAIRVLARNLPESQKQCCEVLKSILNDGDIEIQEAALSIAFKLIKLDEDIAKEARICLQQRVESESMWRDEINAVLGNKLSGNNNASDDKNAVGYLKAALEKLKFSPDEMSNQMVMDCY